MDMKHQNVFCIFLFSTNFFIFFVQLNIEGLLSSLLVVSEQSFNSGST